MKTQKVEFLIDKYANKKIEAYLLIEKDYNGNSLIFIPKGEELREGHLIIAKPVKKNSNIYEDHDDNSISINSELNNVLEGLVNLEE